MHDVLARQFFAEVVTDLMNVVIRVEVVLLGFLQEDLFEVLEACVGGEGLWLNFILVGFFVE